LMYDVIPSHVYATIKDILGSFDLRGGYARIDHYRSFMRYAKAAAQKDPVRMAPIVLQLLEDFYNRNEFGMVEIKAISPLDTRHTAIEIEARAKDKKIKILIDHQHKMSFSAVQRGKDGARYVDRMDSVCETTGIPAPYFIGVLDMAKAFRKKEESLIAALKKRNKNLMRENISLYLKNQDMIKKVMNQRSVIASWPKEVQIKISDKGYSLPSMMYGIAELRKKYKGVCGVYIAVSTDGECQYVGMSENIGSRVSISRKELADCMIGICPVQKTEVAQAESYFIGLLGPKRNKSGMKRMQTRQPRASE